MGSYRRFQYSPGIADLLERVPPFKNEREILQGITINPLLQRISGLSDAAIRKEKHANPKIQFPQAANASQPHSAMAASAAAVCT